MGGSSKQVTGYRYFANFLLFIGNPIEKVLGINFDKRGWQTPLIDEEKNPLAIGDVNLPNLYGENEGGVAGQIHARYGTANPQPVDFYRSYLAKNDLPPLAYPYQSCLAFKDFYLGNSGYMKEMLLWPKRTRIRNDGREQWYATGVERPWVCEIPQTHFYASESKQYISHVVRIPVHINSFGNVLPYTQSDARDYNPGSEIVLSFAYAPIFSSGGSYDDRSIEVSITFSLENVTGLHEVNAEFVARGEQVLVEPIGSWLEFSVSSEKDESTALRTVIVKGIMDAGGVLGISIHCIKPDLAMNNTWGLFYSCDYFRLSKTDGNFKTKTEAPDINPIHKIREILTDDTAMSKPESDVNDINFMKAADRIWDEGLGISWSITEKSCLEAIEELCGHIEAGVRVNRQTGLYEMVLFRDDWFDESEIHSIAVNKIKSMSLEVANADEAINQLNVTYYNQDAIKTSSFSIAENASIRNLNGRVNAEDADFPYFMNQRNAAIVAQWKLKQMSSPVWKGSFTTAEYNARKWNRYDLLKLAWPQKWQGEITVRIMKINLGTGADVSIDFVEVVPYSSQLWSDVVIDEPIDVGVQPPLACPYEPFEMPYYLAVMALGQRQVDEELSYENNFGLVGVVAQQPQSNSLYAVMMTHDGTEGEEWVRAATINYEPVAELDQIISRTSTNFIVKDSAAISGLPIGTLIKCGSDWIGTPGEWMVFEGMDPYTGVVSVKRGALDSLPQEWGAGTKLYFCGNDVAFDSTEYVAGEEVLVSALTTTPSGMLENKGSIAIEMNARAFRPYPPANVKLNGNYFPETHVISNDILLTWAHRNRVQQTGGEIIGWYESGVTIENGVTYSIELSTVQDGVIYSASGIGLDSHAILSSVLLQNKAHKLKLWSVRDGFESYQIFEHNFFVESVSLVLTATAAKDKVIGSTVPTANISVNVDESLKANMSFDGSSISVKAEPNAVITIEIKE
ncbi:phage tail protein [Acinetobacter sp. YH12069]|uniref:phage tail protein n=1 Tax=Acinetobacter sp. YH12069 TaxID=2601065 RepID=UPI0015D18CED|nr:phage tail protein [Acinetobacter sp. YH12069]